MMVEWLNIRVVYLSMMFCSINLSLKSTTSAAKRYTARKEHLSIMLPLTYINVVPPCIRFLKHRFINALNFLVLCIHWQSYPLFSWSLRNCYQSTPTVREFYVTVTLCTGTIREFCVTVTLCTATIREY